MSNIIKTTKFTNFFKRIESDPQISELVSMHYETTVDACFETKSSLGIPITTLRCSNGAWLAYGKSENKYYFMADDYTFNEEYYNCLKQTTNDTLYII